jgi:hypothetical protein
LVVRVVIGSLEHFFRYLEMISLTISFRLLRHNLNVLAIHGLQVHVSGMKSIAAMNIDAFVNLPFPKGEFFVFFLGWRGGLLLGRRTGR